MPITSAFLASPPRRSTMSFVTAPGPHPRSTILRRPGQITRSMIQRFTSVKKGCRVNASNEKRSASSSQRTCIPTPALPLANPQRTQVHVQVVVNTVAYNALRVQVGRPGGVYFLAVREEGDCPPRHHDAELVRGLPGAVGLHHGVARRPA